jgi:hypothetical protein
MWAKFNRYSSMGIKGHKDFQEFFVTTLVDVSTIVGFSDHVLYFGAHEIQVEEDIDEILAKIQDTNNPIDID